MKEVEKQEKDGMLFMDIIEHTESYLTETKGLTPNDYWVFTFASTICYLPQSQSIFTPGSDYGQERPLDRRPNDFSTMAAGKGLQEVNIFKRIEIGLPLCLTVAYRAPYRALSGWRRWQKHFSDQRTCSLQKSSICFTISFLTIW